MSHTPSVLLTLCSVALAILLIQTKAGSVDDASKIRDKRSDDLPALQTVVETLSQQMTSLTAQVNALNDKISEQGTCLNAKIAALEHEEDIVRLADGRILVYRLTSGSGVSAYGSYMAGFNCACQSGGSNPSLSLDRYYRSSFLDRWPSSIIDTVRLSINNGGHEVAYIEFNGQGSTFTNWFSSERVIQSSWTDLKTLPHNFFSIAGDVIQNERYRRFFIENVYGGCPGDKGWLIVVDGVDVCHSPYWAQGSGLPIILYSKLTTVATMNNRADFGLADELTVTVKLRDDALVKQNCPA